MKSSNVLRTANERTQEFLRLLTPCDLSLNAFILALVPNWADAQDIAQEVRIAMWEQFEEFDRSKDFGTWGRAIAYYHVLAYRKRRARASAHMSEQFIETVAEQFSNAPADEDHYGALAECLGRLNTNVRDQLMQYYSGRESIRQIAERLRRSYDATRQSVLRARGWLRKCIETTLTEGPR